MGKNIIDVLTAPMLRKHANIDREPQPNRMERLEQKVAQVEKDMGSMADNMLVLQELILHLRKRIKWEGSI